MNKFGKWLEAELKRRGWSQRELERRAGVSSAMISLVIKGDRIAADDFINKIAGPLGQTPTDLMRLAGRLPELPEADAATLRLIELIRGLPARQRQEVEQFVEFLLSKKEGEAPDVEQELLDLLEVMSPDQFVRTVKAAYEPDEEPGNGEQSPRAPGQILQGILI